MVEVVLQGAGVLCCINQENGDDSLSLLAFRRDVVYAVLRNIQKKAGYPRAM